MVDKRLLIINADDLGYDPEVTRGILDRVTTEHISDDAQKRADDLLQRTH